MTKFDISYALVENSMHSVRTYYVFPKVKICNLKKKKLSFEQL